MHGYRWLWWFPAHVLITAFMFVLFDVDTEVGTTGSFARALAAVYAHPSENVLYRVMMFPLARLPQGKELIIACYDYRQQSLLIPFLWILPNSLLLCGGVRVLLYAGRIVWADVAYLTSRSRRYPSNP